MSKRIIPLIMCGGAGTRLWPASREVRPNNFCRCLVKRSTFQDTILRGCRIRRCLNARSSLPTRRIDSWSWSSSVG